MPILVIRHDSAPTLAPTLPGFAPLHVPRPERVISKGHSRLFELSERLKRSPRFRVLSSFLLMNEIPVGRRFLAWLDSELRERHTCKCRRCQALRAERAYLRD